jgi:hypothetical protein
VSRFNGSQLSVMSTSNRKIVLPEQFSGIGIARYGQLAAGSKETSPDMIRVGAFDSKADNCNFVGIIIKKNMTCVDYSFCETLCILSHHPPFVARKNCRAKREQSCPRKLGKDI